MTEAIVQLIPLLITAGSIALLLWGVNWLLLVRPKAIESQQRFYRQLIMLALTLIAALCVALALPVDHTTKNQIIGLMGLVVSGAIAFSSTTIIANLMAGVMMRVTKPFVTGDFINVGDVFGRVAERGLLDTEIQTESRELVALPNSFLITRPVAVTRSSGALVSVELSLGYDVHHAHVERLLVAAASACVLRDPFVQLLALGDFSVTYRVNGLLEEVEGLLTARSDLRRRVLDVLHENGVEIVSPNFMNQRLLDPNAAVIPAPESTREEKAAHKAEDIVFDKAEEAQRIEKHKAVLLKQIEEIDASLKTASADDKKRLSESLEAIHARLKAIEDIAKKDPPAM